MPELPDVETWKRYLDATSLHQKIEKIELHAPRMLQGVFSPQLRQTLQGSRFTAVRRHGKFLFIHVGTGRWLILHFGTTGRLEYRCKGR